MRMGNILITGASGFIGSALVDAALQRGFTTFAGIRSTSNRQYLAHPGIHFLEFNLNDAQALDISLQALRNRYGHMDVIIHAAGVTKSVGLTGYSRVNFEHTKTFVQALIRNGLAPGKFVYISSLASFGPGTKRAPISLSQDQKPASEYGRSKLETERFLRGLRNFPSVIINPTAVYGPRDRGFLPVLKGIWRGLDIGLSGNDRLLSFLHIDDLCQAVFLCAGSPVLYRQFLVSDLRTYTQRNFTDVARSILNKSPIPVRLPAWIASGIAGAAETISYITGKAAIVNRDRLCDFKALNWSVDCPELVELGFKPSFNLEAGLRQTIGWYQAEGWLKT